ncbi:MAG: AMIN domain-containing protein, partial [Thermoanaerobaculia bacterium]|nr:AMIN domain-containing protein [Thermoanaerobaculia bacterium]
MALEAPLGTPENPYRGPEPTGVVASRMDDVEITSREGDPVVLIRGDGNFRYSSFQLDDPTRFVVDLHGVTNLAPVATIPADAGALERVRVAQFQSQPEAISRVVLDLEASRYPVLEPTGEGLMITLEEGPVGVAEETVPSPSPTPAPERAADEPELEMAGEEHVEVQPAEPDPEAEEVEEVTIVEEESEVEEEPESMADVQPAPETPAPTPGPPPAPLEEEEPTDVSLFEAQEIDEAIEPEIEEEDRDIRFEAQDVTVAEREYVGEPINFS